MHSIGNMICYIFWFFFVTFRQFRDFYVENTFFSYKKLTLYVTGNIDFLENI